MKIHAYHIPGNPGGFCLNQPDRGVWEGYDINIPDDIIYGYNMFDEPILTLGGSKYAISQVLSEWGGKPCLRWFDGKEHRMTLE